MHQWLLSVVTIITSGKKEKSIPNFINLYVDCYPQERPFVIDCPNARAKRSVHTDDLDRDRRQQNIPLPILCGFFYYLMKNLTPRGSVFITSTGSAQFKVIFKCLESKLSREGNGSQS